MRIGPRSTAQPVAQATNADESACMAVVPGLSCAGANCAHSVTGTKAINQVITTYLYLID